MKPSRVGALLLGLVLLALMQNCTEVDFAGQSDNGPSEAGGPNPPDDGLPPLCPGGQTYDGTSCVPFQATCASFQELTGDPIMVPARDGSGVCYYVKLINQKALVNSSNYPNMRSDITARRFTGTDYPRIMDSREINELRVLGPREIILSGSTDGTAKVRVDNFFLLETQFASQGQTVTKLFGQGTGDVRPQGGQPILVSGQEVVYVPGLAAGTDIIDPVDLQFVTPIDKPVKLRLSALDCGLVGETSDIYVLFR